jgi:hypothetical protein
MGVRCCLYTLLIMLTHPLCATEPQNEMLACSVASEKRLSSISHAIISSTHHHSPAINVCVCVYVCVYVCTCARVCVFAVRLCACLCVTGTARPPSKIHIWPPAALIRIINTHSSSPYVSCPGSQHEPPHRPLGLKCSATLPARQPCLCYITPES